MIRVSYDKPRNVVVIEFLGTVTPADGEQFFLDAEHVLPKCGNGFAVLTDISGLDRIEPDVKDAIARSMDLLNSHGVKKVVRVIPDPAKDIGFNILSIFHYDKDVMIMTVESREEGWERLRKTNG